MTPDIETGDNWLPIADAATALGISARTLKRRIADADVALPSRLENGRRLVAVPFGTGTASDNRASGTGPEGQQGQGQRDNERKNGPIVTMTKGQSGHLAQRQAGTEGTEGTTTGTDAVSLLVEQRDRDREEIAFLRAMMEGLQQSEAQTKAALREALKAMPKALTAGTPGPNEPARIEAQGPQNRGGRGRDGGDQNVPERDDGAVTYASIADELENTLGVNQ